MTLSVAGLTVALERGSASAKVPASLVRSTVGHAACVAAIPESIQTLVKGVLHTMRYAQIRKALPIAIAAVLLGGSR